jgi:hypothetical protein
MGEDIIAESQTESVLAMLERGDADDKVRDQVSAALLRALTKVSRELTDIKDSLWTPDALRHAINEQHVQQCANCPAKRMAEERLQLQQAQAAQAVQMVTQSPAAQPSRTPQGVVQWILYLAGNSSFQFFILLLFLIGAFIYLTTGKGGVDAAKGTVNTVIHGGAQ